VQRIKDGQRQDSTFKEMWWKFCDSHAEGIRDPARHPVENLQQFLQLSAQLGAMGPAVQPMAQPRLPMLPGAAPARGPGKFGGPPEVDMSDPSKLALVSLVKDHQRTDPGFKEAWGAYCDMNCQGVRDPNRHTSDVLRHFLAERGIAPPNDYGPSSFNAPKRGNAWGPY
jgi:hypothetical protein